MRAPIIGQPVVAAIAVDLEDALAPLQHPFRMGATPSRCIGEDHPGRIVPAHGRLSRSIAQR